MDMTRLVGLIPAAGRGVRLGLPYPKELYPIIRDNRYKPVAQFVLENLTVAQVEHIIFVINETKHQLLGYFGDGSRFGCHISYVVQENREDPSRSTSPGLAHALHSAYHLIQQQTVLFGMADTIIEPKAVFAQMLEAARPEDDVLLGLFRTEHPDKFGMVRFDAMHRIEEIIDKPSQTQLEYMWGCIAWGPRFTEHLHHSIAKGCADFAQIMNTAINAGQRFRAVCLAGSYTDLGTYEEVSALEQKYRAE